MNFDELEWQLQTGVILFDPVFLVVRQLVI